MQELACVDLAGEIGERALEVVRSNIERAAAADKSKNAALLLQECEAEKNEAAVKERDKGIKKVSILMQATLCVPIFGPLAEGSGSPSSSGMLVHGQESVLSCSPKLV